MAMRALERGAPQEAVEHLDAALAVNPTARWKDQPARMFRALLLLDQGAFDRAFADAQACIDSDPRDAAAWLALGRAQAGAGSHAAAITSFDEALRLRPGWSDASWHRAASRAVLHDFVGALADFEEALRTLAPYALGSAREARIYEARAQLRLLAEDRPGARLDYIRAAAIWDARGEAGQVERIVGAARALGL